MDVVVVFGVVDEAFVLVRGFCYGGQGIVVFVVIFFENCVFKVVLGYIF